MAKPEKIFPSHYLYFGNMRILFFIVCFALLFGSQMQTEAQNKQAPLVLMSDFGTKERFVASMKGVAMQVDKGINLFDLTHEITPFDIWEASHTLAGTIAYWPEGTVFVSVVDPGVGTERKSVVVTTQSGHYIVTPDNGTLTHVADQIGIEEVREIDENVNRLAGSEDAYTFHGRDVYAYTGARLAAGIIDFKDVGIKLPPEVAHIDYQKATAESGKILGNIVKVEHPYGNLVTNIPREILEKQGIDVADGAELLVKISKGTEVVYEGVLPYLFSFGHVEKGDALLYPDSIRKVGLAVNSGNFAKKYEIGAGPDWTIEITIPEE